MPRVRVLSWDNGDWDAIELDGKLFYEGHSIPFGKWLELLLKFVPVEELTVHYDDDEYGPINYDDWAASDVAARG